MEKQLIPAGYKQTEVGVIPEDWNVLELSYFVSALEAGVSVNSIEAMDEFGHGKSVLKTSCISGGYFFPHEGKGIVPKDLGRARINPRGGSILISRMNTPDLVGEVGYVDSDYPDLYLPDRLWQVKYVGENRVNGRWLAFILSYPDVAKKIKDAATGTSNSMKNISKGSLLGIKFAAPEKTEQTAIANALSDVDALIAALEKLINKKSAIKTAAMQQLLIGKKRLPPFDQLNTGYKQTELGEIPGDWEVAAVHQLLKESPKYGINAAAVPLTANLPVYIRITDISEDGYFQPSERVGVNNQFSDFYKLKKGDIVLARTGASVGKSYLYREADGELIYAGFLIKLSPKESILDSMFLFQYLRSDPYWAWVNVMSMRSGQPGINGNEFGSLQIPLPSIEEQIAIANVFSDMDKDLETLHQRLHKTQQIKQGMMQELLTGKTRLVNASAIGASA